MFRNRLDAGGQLAMLLKEYAGKPCVIYALPRGGVPVAYPVSSYLAVPLDVLVVKKVGAPGQEELAMAAVTEGEPPAVHYNAEVLHYLDLGQSETAFMVERKSNEARENAKYYRNDKTIQVYPEKTAIIIDDGVATGASVKAAVEFFRSRGCREIVVAVPVGADETLSELEDAGVRVIAVQRVKFMSSVGEFYEDFAQTEREEAKLLLERAAEELGGQ